MCIRRFLFRFLKYTGDLVFCNAVRKKSLYLSLPIGGKCWKEHFCAVMSKWQYGFNVAAWGIYVFSRIAQRENPRLLDAGLITRAYIPWKKHPFDR